MVTRELATRVGCGTIDLVCLCSVGDNLAAIIPWCHNNTTYPVSLSLSLLSDLHNRILITLVFWKPSETGCSRRIALDSSLSDANLGTMRPAKAKGGARALKPVDDGRVGKRKAAAPVDKGGKGKAKQTKKAKKDPNKPKKPPSAFFVFLAEFRVDFKKKNPNVKGVAAVGKAGGEKWRSMTDAEKAHYEAQSAKAKTEYEKQMKIYDKKQSAPDDGDEESERSRSEVHDEDDEASGEEAQLKAEEAEEEEVDDEDEGEDEEDDD
ncbi:hypothetical protein ACLB2K_065319 [Fragaria x ananassa]